MYTSYSNKTILVHKKFAKVLHFVDYYAAACSIKVIVTDSYEFVEKTFKSDCKIFPFLQASRQRRVEKESLSGSRSGVLR